MDLRSWVKHPTELVVGHFADVATRTAERGDAGDGVGDRAAGHLDGLAHRVEEPVQLVRLDERHGRLDQSELRVDLVESCEMMSSMALPMPVTASRFGPGFTRSDTGVGVISHLASVVNIPLRWRDYDL